MSVLGRARKRTLRNVYGVGSPTVGQNCSVRLHICAVTYITEILLHVTKTPIHSHLHSQDIRGSYQFWWGFWWRLQFTNYRTYEITKSYEYHILILAND